MLETNNTLGTKEWYALISQGADALLTVRPSGTSMLPLIRGGKDTVLVAPLKRDPVKGDILLFHRFDGKDILHRVWKIKDGSIIMLGDGSIGPDKPITKSDILGIAVTLIRDGKTIPLDTRSCRIRGRIHQKFLFPRNLLRRIRRKLIRL